MTFQKSRIPQKTGQSEIRPKTDLYDPILVQDRISRGPILTREIGHFTQAYLSRPDRSISLGRNLQYNWSKTLPLLDKMTGIGPLLPFEGRRYYLLLKTLVTGTLYFRSTLSIWKFFSLLYK